jgi:cation transport ATPase
MRPLQLDALALAQHRVVAITAASLPGAPAVGAILMSVSTIVVALNAQLLRRIDLRPEAHR